MTPRLAVVAVAVGLSLAACTSRTSYLQPVPAAETMGGIDSESTDAERALLARIDADPADFDAYYNLAVAYEARGRVEQAESSYRRTLLLEPRHIPAAVNLAALYRDRGDLRKAIVVLNDLFDTGVDDPRARTDLAILYRLVGEFDRSLYESSEVLRRFGLVYGAMLNAALVYYDMGRYEMALTLLKELDRQFPQDSRIHFSIGQTYQALGNPIVAAQEYQLAVSLDAGAFEAHNNLGILHLLKGDYREAVTAFTRAVKANVNYADGYLNLGIAWRNLNDYPKAGGAYRRAIKIRPNFKDAWYNLGLLFDDYWDGQFDQALATWREYLQRFESSLSAEERAEIEARIASLNERREKFRATGTPETAPQPVSAPATTPATAPAATPVTTPAPAPASAPADTAAEAQPPAAEPAAAQGYDPDDIERVIGEYNEARRAAGLPPVEPANLRKALIEKAQQLFESSGVKFSFRVDVVDDKPKLVPVPAQ